VAISSTYAVASGTFTGTFAPNSNASFLGQVFLEFSGTANKTVSWTSFTYTAGTVAIKGNITQSGNLTTTGTTSVGNRLLGQANAPTDNFWLGLRGTGTEGDRLAIAIRGNGTTGLVSDVLFQKNLAMSAGTAFTHTGGNSGANLLNIQGNDPNNSPYLGFYTANTRRCYIGFATDTNMYIVCENNANLNLQTQGSIRMTIDTAGNTDFNSRELRVSQLNSGVCQFRMKSGSQNIASMFHCNGTELYVLATNNGDWTGSYNGLRPLYLSLTGGGCTMQEGLTLTGGNLTLTGGAGRIATTNQPFCIVGGVAGASVGYGVGAIWGGAGRLFAYTSAGMSNVFLNGWDSSSGVFFPPVGGKWRVAWSFYWNNFAGGSRGTITVVNSSSAITEVRYVALNGGGIGSDTTQAYSGLFFMNAGDRMYASFQSGSGTLYFGGITHTHCSFYYEP
jgi:hypothetical protein